MLTRVRSPLPIALISSAMLLASLLVAAPSRAATFTIGCPGGVGDVSSLASAFATAASNGEADTIILSAGCTYTATVTADTSTGNTAFAPVTDDGGNATTLEGNGATITSHAGRFFLVSGGTLYLGGVTLNGSDPGCGEGGAIFVQTGTLELTGSTVT